MSSQMVKLAHIDDFATVRMRSYKLLARPVGIFKERDGSFRAMEVGCKHENTDLLNGHIDGDVVTCPWHKWRYNLRTGECLWGSTACLRPYALEVREGGYIYVSLRPIDPEGFTNDGEW